MKTLKKLAVALVLVAGLGMAFASCSDNYYENPENLPIPPGMNPIEPEKSPY